MTVVNLDNAYTMIWLYTGLGMFFMYLSFSLRFKQTTVEPAYAINRETEDEDGNVNAEFAPRVNRVTGYDRFSGLIFSAICIPIWISISWTWLTFAGLYSMVSLIFFALLVFSVIMTFLNGLETFASSTEA